MFENFDKTLINLNEKDCIRGETHFLALHIPLEHAQFSTNT